ncbi:MAG: transcription-repair coupling factor, partial [Saprospiraceae bacterium]|nr:transcription-repair coupling factor [Saprospiraceae bacterium]
MSNQENLIKAFQEDPRLQSLVAGWQEKTGAVHTLTGLVGSMESMILAASYLQNPRTFLVVAEDKEAAAYLQNDLSGLLQPKIIRFFPDSFKRPMQFEALNQNNVLLRTETVNRISLAGEEGEIIIAYPEALFEQVVSPEELEANRLFVKVGEDLDVDTVISLLGEFGFRQEEFVYEPGQFAIRGGIIDIFSYGNEYPYRIELFDEEVESIRHFDPMNQLSVREIRQVSIVPNINSRFNREQKLPLFDILPEGSVVWIRDYQWTIDKLQECFEKAESFADKLSKSEEEDLAELFRDRAFIRPGAVLESLE